MSFDSSCGFLFNHLHYYGGCQYAKDTTLIAVCVVEFSGQNLAAKINFFTVQKRNKQKRRGGKANKIPKIITGKENG